MSGISNKKIQQIVDGWSPLWLGISISATLLAALLLSETVLGRWNVLLAGGEFDPLARVSSGVLRDLRIAIVHCLVMGYLPAAFLHVLRSGRQTVFLLQDALNCTPEECESLAASLRPSTRGLVITALLALALSFMTPYIVPPVPENPWSFSSWNPEVVWHRILGPTAMVWVWWLGYAIILVSIRLARIAKRLRRVDLLDLSPLAPFTQQGLTNALLLIGELSIWSLMMIETGFGMMMVFVGSTMLAGIAIAMLYPVRGVHVRIRQSKEEELAWVNGEIAAQRSALRSSEPDRQSGNMADLVSYRGLVEGVPEWPFTTSTYTRLSLYALIPVLSWGVGVVAEELVGNLLF